MTLFALEKKLRSYRDPRIHFCLCFATRTSIYLFIYFIVCELCYLILFSLGPRLLRQLFMGKFLNQQMDQCTYAFVNVHRGIGFVIDKSLEKMRLELSPLFPR